MGYLAVARRLLGGDHVCYYKSTSKLLGDYHGATWRVLGATRRLTGGHHKATSRLLGGYYGTTWRLGC